MHVVMSAVQEPPVAETMRGCTAGRNRRPRFSRSRSIEAATTPAGCFRGPKQHELDQRDFDAYAEQLKVLSDRHPGRVQIVFSVADLKTHFEATDEVWDPSCRLGTELRFLVQSRGRVRELPIS